MLGVFTTSSRWVGARAPEADGASAGRGAGTSLEGGAHLAYQDTVSHPSPTQGRQRDAENSSHQRSSHAHPSPGPRAWSCTCGFGTRSSPGLELGVSDWRGVPAPVPTSTSAAETAFLARTFALSRRGRVACASCGRGSGPWSGAGRGRYHRRGQCRGRPGRGRARCGGR